MAVFHGGTVALIAAVECAQRTTPHLPRSPKSAEPLLECKAALTATELPLLRPTSHPPLQVSQRAAIAMELLLPGVPTSQLATSYSMLGDLYAGVCVCACVRVCTCSEGIGTSTAMRIQLHVQ